MTVTSIGLVAAILYIVSGVLLGRRLRIGSHSAGSKNIILVLVGSGIILHAAVLYQSIMSGQDINLGFFNALSLVAWLIALILWVGAWTKPIENLGIVLLPIAGIAIFLQLYFFATHTPTGGTPMAMGIKLHVLMSVLAYSLLSIAALQSVLLAIQDRHLHNKHPGGFIRALPPLQLMEKIMFQMIGSGFILLTLALASGIVFLEDIFAQHLVHKTTLSIVAWFVFATLLWGRWQFGWRGRTAIRWTLSGIVVLMLAYFGSKLVLEFILAR